MQLPKLLICTISVVATALTTQVQAQNLSTTLINFQPTLQVMGTLTADPVGEDLTSGVMKFESDSGNFDAFCVQPAVPMSFGDTPTYQIQDISLLPAAGQIAQLIGGYISSAQTNEDAAAVQWAIWEITNEVTLPPSLLDGNVQVISPTAIATKANDFLTNINTFAPVELVYLTDGTAQNVVTWSVNIVPEPSSACLVVLSALCVFRRRR